MMNRIINILKNTNGISDWKVNSIRTESTELFFVHKDLETVRSTDTTDIKVTVYVTHDERLGEATFSVYSSYDDAKTISDYAKTAMQYVVGSDLIKGKTVQTLNPEDNTTRAEIAAILQRFIE